MRNSKLFKLIMMSILLCTASAAFASSASALTTNGPGNFTATAPASLWTINASGGAVGVQCSTTGLSGSLRALSGVAVPVQVTNSVTLSFSGCTVAGLPATVTCSATATQFWATSNVISGVLAGQVRGISCTIRPTSFPSCTINLNATSGWGAAILNFSFGNWGAQFTFAVSGQSLTATWANCPFITPSSGSASVGWTSVGFSALIYTVTSAFKPIFS